jgi:hypothetical protein
MTFPTVSNNQNIACPSHCHPAQQSNPTNACTSIQGGEAVFENKNYRITANDDNTVNIYDKKTGDTTKISGDPHVDVNGEHAFDFWGKTTFDLKDGTKVTIDTTPATGNPEATLASKVTITNGDYGVRISGIDSNTKGDLKVDEAAGFGQELDAVTTDGNVIQQNPEGKGYLAVDENGKIQKVDQTYINKTDSVKTGHLEDKYQAAMEKFKDLVGIAFQGVFVGKKRPSVGKPHVHGSQHRHPKVGSTQVLGSRSDLMTAKILSSHPTRIKLTTGYVAHNGAPVAITIRPRMPLEFTPEGLVRMEYKQETKGEPGMMYDQALHFNEDVRTIELPPGAKGFELRGQKFNLSDFH